MRNRWMALAAVAAMLVAGPAGAETLTNASVVGLVQAGLGPEAVVAKIRASTPAFDTSAEQLVALKRASVPDEVIAAMVDAEAGGLTPYALTDSADPLAPHASGVYLLDPGAPRMRRVEATISDNVKVSGVLALALTYGLAHVTEKADLPGPAAAVSTTEARPVFYFYFDSENSSLSGWRPLAPTSPAAFTLVRFSVSGGQRETQYAQFNITGAKPGPDAKSFSSTYAELAPGIFKVTPDADLPPGQYGYLYTVDGGDDSGTEVRVFDFAVQAP